MWVVVSAVLFSGVMFKPVRDHQLNVSLNVGLLPASKGLYSFGYVCYRYKLGRGRHAHDGLPAHTRMGRTLVGGLSSVRARNVTPSMVAFTKGNRPAVRPRFTSVVSSAVRAHGHFFPGTGVTILSGSAVLRGRSIFLTLGGVRSGVLGLSSVSSDHVKRLGIPGSPTFAFSELLRRLYHFGNGLVVRAVFLGKRISKRDIAGAARRRVSN